MSLLDEIIEKKCDVGNICPGRPKIIFGEKCNDFGKIFSNMKNPIAITSMMNNDMSGVSKNMIYEKADKLINRLENNPRVKSFTSLYVEEYNHTSHLGCCFMFIEPESKTPYEAFRTLLSIISTFSFIFYNFDFFFAYKKSFEPGLGKWTFKPSKTCCFNDSLKYKIYEMHEIRELKSMLEYMCGRPLTDPEYAKCAGRLTKFVKWMKNN